MARGVVAPLKLVFIDLTEAYARLRTDPRVVIDAEVDAPRDLVELALALLDCRERYGVRTAFAFSASNRRAANLEQVAERTLGSRGFVVGRVDGTMRARERESRLAPLRREEAASEPTWLVTNCRVLAEGVDVPAVDLVAFADAKQSHVDILQCMGRASRVAPGKECGYVLVPVSEEAGEEGPLSLIHI